MMNTERQEDADEQPDETDATSKETLEDLEEREESNRMTSGRIRVRHPMVLTMSLRNQTSRPDVNERRVRTDQDESCKVRCKSRSC